MVSQVETQFLGKTLKIETGRIARQAHGAVILSYDDLVLLATAVSPYEVKEDTDFFPLTVDYRERFPAVGKFPGGYMKRENRPTDKEILTMRCIDRPMRPLFPADYYNEVQIMLQVLSAKRDVDPDTMAVTAASAAVAVSDIPFACTLAAVRVVKVDGELIINPNDEQRAKATLDFVVAGSATKVVMIEGEAKQAPEADVTEAIAYAFKELQPLIKAQDELAAKIGVVKREYTHIKAGEKAMSVCETYRDRITEALRIPGKAERNDKLAELRKAYVEEVQALEECADENVIALNVAFEDLTGVCLRKLIREEGHRVDGRGLDEIRPITCETGFLPRCHGSALFTRGETQALVTLTLGTADDAQGVEGLAGETQKKFMLHYTFPPYSVGEARPLRGPGRREIGHGNLAERSLKFLVPEDFDYTIRITSDITESNGSSSMASVCGGCLSLMDAGVPIDAPVAGISVGLVADDDEYTLITDIVGDEDHYGHMDFKVAGSKKGVTGVQVDLKVEGLPVDLLPAIFERARSARLRILNIMAKELPAPRPELSPLAPKILTIKIPVDKIGALIGPGGKNVRAIQEQTGTTISIEDDGTVQIAGDSLEIAQKGKEIVEAMMATAEIGKTYHGTVTRLMSFGAFVKILPDVEGMVHISEIRDERVEKIEDVLKEGDEVDVRVIEIDDKGRVNLSMKHLDEPFDPSKVKSRSQKDSERRGRSEGGRPRREDRRPRRQQREDSQDDNA